MLSATLTKQFSAAFGILKKAIPSFSPADWVEGGQPFNGPARATLHVLQCAVFYTNGDREPFQRFYPSWPIPTENLPSQETMLAFCDEAQQKTAAWIDAIGDAGLTQPNAVEPKVMNLERIVYALRHLQHHIGEICAYQKKCGLPPAEWR